MFIIFNMELPIRKSYKGWKMLLEYWVAVRGKELVYLL